MYEQVDLRPGYGWEGGYGSAAIENYRKATEMDRAAYLREREEVTEEEAQRRFRALERKVDQIMAEQTPEGYWIRGDRISCGAFVQACNALCSYLEQWKKYEAPALGANQ